MVSWISLLVLKMKRRLGARPYACGWTLLLLLLPLVLPLVLPLALGLVVLPILLLVFFAAVMDAFAPRAQAFVAVCKFSGASLESTQKSHVVGFEVSFRFQVVSSL